MDSLDCLNDVNVAVIRLDSSLNELATLELCTVLAKLECYGFQLVLAKCVDLPVRLVVVVVVGMSRMMSD